MNTSQKHSALFRAVAFLAVLAMMLTAVAVPFASAMGGNVARLNVQKRNDTSFIIRNLMIGQTDIADYLFKGADKLVNLFGKGDPVALSLANGFLGAFKSFYGDFVPQSQPSTADVIHMLEQLRDELKRHHDVEMQLLNYGLTLDKLQGFASHLNSAVTHNRFGLKYIALYETPDIEEFDVIIRETIGREGLLNTFGELSTDLTLGAIALHGIPALEQYLIGAAACEENGFNYDNVYADAMLFNQMTMEQYCLLYTVILTGYLARYEQLDLLYAEGLISESARNAEQAAAVAAMQEYTAMAKDVSEKYLACCDKLDGMHVADVTVDGVTTPKCSLADAWITALTAGKDATVTLTGNVDRKDLGADAIEFDRPEYFKDGALLLENIAAKITLDLNGFSLCGAEDYVIFVKNAALNVINGSGFSGILDGLFAQNATVTLENVAVLDTDAYGLYIEGGRLDMTDCLIKGTAKSGIYTYHSDTVLNGCTIASCGNRELCGGGIFADGSGLALNDCFVIDCIASRGGGIYTNDNSSFCDVTFQGNASEDEGGALYLGYLSALLPPQFTVNGCLFRQNKAGTDGGAIFADSLSKLDLCDTVITENQAGGHGGGLFCQKGKASACDPTVHGLITILGNVGKTGIADNVFLQENATSKCLLVVVSGTSLDPASRIGLNSNTNDADLDVVQFQSGTNWDACRAVFSYDTADYTIRFYNPWYSASSWVEIVK